ncbi:MAG: ankyrin repeat domain-containing protein [Pseudomonadota bacterium]
MSQSVGAELSFDDMLTAVVAGDADAVTAALSSSSGRASWIDARVEADRFVPEIACYVYVGDTALHVAAAAYQVAIVRRLVRDGANVCARNRRGGEPLHYAAVGLPGAPSWNPRQQHETIAALLAAGANPNAVDKSGTTPLHRAVRTRCAAAVEALLTGGADPSLVTKSGASPLRLAMTASGRGGTGSDAAKAQQAEIVRLLEACDAS